MWPDGGYAAGQCQLLDLDKDGVLEIVNFPELTRPDEDPGTKPRIYDVYKFDGQRYRPWKKFNLFETFVRSLYFPTIKPSSFSVTDTNIPYVLKILNGDSKGQNMVDGAEVRMNDVVVIGPENFNQKVSEMTLPVKIKNCNTLRVELTGSHGREITVLVEPQK